MSAEVDNALAKMTRAGTVLDALTIYAQSVPGWIRAARDEAQAGGATASELAPLTLLADELDAKATAAQTAALAGTPDAPQPA